jgi:hypothetical protein
MANDTEPVMVPWTAVIAVEGEESGDGRVIPVDGIEWGDGPWPITAPDMRLATVGSVDRVWRDFGPGDTRLIQATGTIDLAVLDGAARIPCGLDLFPTQYEPDPHDGQGPLRVWGTINVLAVYHTGRAAWPQCRLTLDGAAPPAPPRRRNWLVEAYRSFQLNRGLRRLYGRDDWDVGPEKTREQMLAEADLWDRYGDPEIAAMFRLDAETVT